tara:strand:- start:165 stop:425 length:261 start_codon:yes stop_codon:yes gene_type:complete
MCIAHAGLYDSINRRIIQGLPLLLYYYERGTNNVGVSEGRRGFAGARLEKGRERLTGHSKANGRGRRERGEGEELGAMRSQVLFKW